MCNQHPIVPNGNSCQATLILGSKFSSLRIAECSEVHSKLQAHFSLNLQEMYDLGKHINNIKNAIR